MPTHKTTGKKKGPVVLVVPTLDTEGPTVGRDDLYDDWDDLQAALHDLTKRTRFECRDAEGSPAVFSWFVLDWVGYDDADPTFKKRGHTTGFHRIFDAYRATVLSDAALLQSGDGLYWHYHHPPKDGSWGWNRNWNDSDWYERVLNRKILERNFFPPVFRAGGYVEDNETSKWLERWIPFDYSNNSPAFKEGAYDWRRAPREWTPYHPSRKDYQVSGDMRRTVARCLPVEPKGGSNTFTKDDVEAAFESARKGECPTLSFSTHDYYKSAAEEFGRAYALITDVAREYGDVSWEYRNALDAMRESMALPTSSALKLSAEQSGNTVVIRSNRILFGEMPYVAVRFSDGREERRDAKTIDETTWIVSGSNPNAVIGVGASDACGNTAVITM